MNEIAVALDAYSADRGPTPKNGPWVVAVVATLSMSSLPAAAYADNGSPDAEVNRIATIARDLAPDSHADVVLAASPDGSFRSTDSVSEVVLPNDAATGVLLTPLAPSILDTSLTPVSFEVALPSADSMTDGAMAPNGQVVYVDTKSGATDLALEPVTSGVRIQTVINTSSAPLEYSYPITGGVTPVLSSDGGVDLVQASDGVELLVGRIDIPWAVDANGRDVATHFDIRGSSVVQVVDHHAEGIAFPVVADPSVKVINPLQARVRFSRAETATAASAGWAAAGGSAACGLAGSAIAGPPGAALAAAGCFTSSAAIVIVAGNAQNSSPKRCVQVTLTYLPLVVPGFAISPTHMLAKHEA